MAFFLSVTPSTTAKETNKETIKTTNIISTKVKPPCKPIFFPNTTGSNNLALGYYAGLYNTTVSNQLFINTLDRGSYANDVSNSLIYGIFNATPANQTLSLNAGIINMPYLPTADPHVLGQIYQVLATHVLMVSNG